MNGGNKRIDMKLPHLPSRPWKKIARGGALLRAAVNHMRGAAEQGGSTITQQRARLNYTNRRRGEVRKVREVVYPAQLERQRCKDEWLERYLNQESLVEGADGVKAAART